MKIGLTIFLLAVVWFFGFGAGYGSRDYIGMRRVTSCSEGVKDGTLKGCSKSIKTAFEARAARLAASGLVDRDNALASTSRGAQEQIIIYRERAADVAEITNVERTHQCAASPAFQLRRRQLQRLVEGQPSDEPDPAQPTG